MLTQPLKALWNEFVYGSHLLSLAASSIVLFSFQILQLKIDWLSLIIPYAMMQIIYKFNYMMETDDYESNPERASHIKRKRRRFVIQMLVFLVALLLVLIHYHQVYLYVFCLVYLLGGLWYPKQITKYIVAFKNIYVTFFWGILGLIPFIIMGKPVQIHCLLLVSFIFFRVLVNAIFADFKDVETDQSQGYKTVPAYAGIKPAMFILQIINILSFAILAYSIYKNYFPSAAWSLFILFFYNMYYIQTANKQSAKNIRIISYVLVDGEYILWPLFMWIAFYIRLQ